MTDKETILADKKLILLLGGPTKVASLLGFDKAKGGVQRVQNWMVRGIPAEQKLARPSLFLPGLIKESGKLRDPRRRSTDFPNLPRRRKTDRGGDD